MVDCAEDLSHIWDARDVDALHRTRIREPIMLDRESTLRRGGELGLECPVLESDLGLRYDCSKRDRSSSFWLSSSLEGP